LFSRDARVLFDQAAEAYDAARPGYPLELVDRLIEETGLDESARILEIGPGTGQLTMSLARRGFQVTAVELGERLARIASRNLAGFPKVQIVQGAFEAWPDEDRSFDVVTCAQAFHWIDPEAGLPKIRRLLVEDGYLAVVYNLFPGSDSPADRDLADVYARCFPGSTGRDSKSALKETVHRVEETIRSSGLFTAPSTWRHAWSETYTTRRYLQLLESFSDHRALPEADRQTLLDAVREVVDAHGGRVHRPLVATLLLTQVR
jgi:ubiquinone/menaquinone biosynthesis C-methylase UbiE